MISHVAQWFSHSSGTLGKPRERTDRAGGLAERARVAREPVVLLTWDPAADGFWLLQEYLPEFIEADRRQFPGIPASGAWHARHGQLLAEDALDVGYRLVVAHLPDRAG